METTRWIPTMFCAMAMEMRFCTGNQPKKKPKNQNAGDGADETNTLCTH